MGGITHLVWEEQRGLGESSRLETQFSNCRECQGCGLFPKRTCFEGINTVHTPQGSFLGMYIVQCSILHIWVIFPLS